MGMEMAVHTPIIGQVLRLLPGKIPALFPI
jgi:hypothetical protein